MLPLISVIGRIIAVRDTDGSLPPRFVLMYRAGVSKCVTWNGCPIACP